MSNNNPNKALITAFSGQQQTLTIPKLYAQALGDINKALFLNQVIFWSSKTKREDGFFYKTYEDWYEEILLTKRKLAPIIKYLKKIQLIETKVKKIGGDPTLHYKANMENIYEFITKHLSKPTPPLDSSNDDPSEPANSVVSNKMSLSKVTKCHFPINNRRILTEEKRLNICEVGTSLDLQTPEDKGLCEIEISPVCLVPTISPIPTIPLTPKTLTPKPRATNTNTNNTKIALAVVLEIFGYWQEVMNHPKARFDNQRRKDIERGFGLGFSVQEMKLAILGCSRTPHNIGVNTSKKRYDSLNLIFRDADHIERFMATGEESSEGNSCSTDFMRIFSK